MKKLLIVDDAAFMRLSIRNMMNNYDIEIVGEAANGVIAVEMYKEFHPDVVTMDITMPAMSGIDALKAIKAFDPQAKCDYGISDGAGGNGQRGHHQWSKNFCGQTV